MTDCNIYHQLNKIKCLGIYFIMPSVQAPNYLTFFQRMPSYLTMMHRELKNIPAYIIVFLYIDF